MTGELAILTAEQEIELDRCEAVIRRGLDTFVEVGTALLKIRDGDLYKRDYSTFEDYCRERWGFTRMHASRMIAAAEVVENVTDRLQIHPPANIEQTRPLASLEPEQQREAWTKAVETAPEGKVTGAHVAKVVEEIKEAEKEPEPEEPKETVSKFNRTSDESIGWAAWTWNPVTGCKHGCPYCYARDIAKRFYPQGFEPTFHPDRLAAPINTPQIQPRYHLDVGYKGVFVCSMADLFGEWVPSEWITSVLDVVEATPQWNYIFLTKNPKRLIDIEWPDNAWVGTTVDCQSRVRPAEYAFERIQAKIKFLSCEPLRERIVFRSLSMFHWVIVGAQSKSSGEPAKQPLWDWVWTLTKQAYDHNCHVYWKKNLEVRPRAYPTV